MNVSKQEDPVDYVYDPYAGSPLSRAQIALYSLIVKVVLTGSFAILGVVSNVINLMVFYRHGPTSSSPTAILTGLSVSDLFVCLIGLWVAFFAILIDYVDTSDWSWNVLYFYAIIIARPLHVVTQTTCLITTFMSIERVVSVTFPFKVKTIFTPKRSILIVVVIFAATTVIHFPNLVEYTPVWVQNADNSSVMMFDLAPFLPRWYQTAYFYVSPVFLRFACLALVLFCNTVLVWKVQSSKKFRDSKLSKTKSSSFSDKEEKMMEEEEKKFDADDEGKKISQPSPSGFQNTHSSTPTTTTTKEMKLHRMMVVISAVFTVSCLLTVICNTLLHLVFRYKVDYHWVVEHVSYEGMVLFQVINSSTNIFIYLGMSSRYKQEFTQVWKGRSKEVL